MTPTNAPATAGLNTASVVDLLQRRDQVHAWLSRLDQLAPDTATRVAERVRADYEERLQSIVDELATHVDSVQREIDRLGAEVATTGELYEAAVDALEEVRLRHQIGEIAGDEWDQRRPELERDVAATADARELALDELARTEDLLAQIVGSPSRAATVRIPQLTIAAPAAEPTPSAAAPVLEPEVVSSAEAAVEATGDVDFLEELDRAITVGASEETGEASYPLTASELEARVKSGMKCPDCGYNNDGEAWYCGVCGVDLN